MAVNEGTGISRVFAKIVKWHEVREWTVSLSRSAGFELDPPFDSSFSFKYQLMVILFWAAIKVERLSST